VPAYYNEFDPKKAAWLRQLIIDGLIAPGEVDERSIEDVLPDELRRYTQCHFFAGVGGWSLALRQAGWPDERPVWTGSCPCQPFSAAGKGEGFADERHLWPAFFHLVSQFRPVTLFGEQVAGSDGETWFDLVQSDLEGVGYTVGLSVLPAAGFGSPHGRHRIYCVADSNGTRCERKRREGRKKKTQRIGAPSIDSCRSGSTGKLGQSDRSRSFARIEAGEANGHRSSPVTASSPCVMGNPSINGVGRDARAISRSEEESLSKRLATRRMLFDFGSPGDLNGFWRDAEWLHCAPEPGYPEGRWRAVEPGTFPLAHGIPARVVRISGYGNAIVPQVAEEFIRAFLEQPQRQEE
jgi:DNA (cytosine-5)-methyltransferase 1